MGAVPAGRLERRVRKEARALVREARRGIARHGDQVAPPARERIELSVERLDKASLEGEHEIMRRELALLDELVDEHLAFGRKSTAREYVESIGAAVLIALLLRGFVVEAFKIPSGSMIPTMEIGDHIFVNKLLYGVRVPFTDDRVLEWRGPRRGEVVVFVDKCSGKDFIKRVVAVAGDVVEVRCNQLYINFERVPTELAAEQIEYFDTSSMVTGDCLPIGDHDWQRCVASDYLSHQGGHDYHNYYGPGRPEHERTGEALVRPHDYWSYMPGDRDPLYRTTNDFPRLDTAEAESAADALMPDGRPRVPPGAERLAAVRRVLAGETPEAVAADLSERDRGRAWCDPESEADEDGEPGLEPDLGPCITGPEIREWFPPQPTCADNKLPPGDEFVAQLVPAPPRTDNDACGPLLGYRIPEGHVWAMGDNREKSSDSREWGPVPLENVKGKALFIWWASQPSYAAGIQWRRMGKIVH